MKLQRLEARVLALVDAALGGRLAEDDRVEMKATWPEARQKTARQIAAQANACSGEPILWLIGVDERRQTITDTTDLELANWWPAVSKWFDGEVPTLTTITVGVAPDRRVAVLQFETDRAPYVVKTEGNGQVEYEVPWRSGNRTRSARRHELLRSVVEQAQVPRLELVSGKLKINEPWDRKADQPAGHASRLELLMNLYVSAAGNAMLPQHRQRWQLRGPKLEPIEFARPQITGPLRISSPGPSGGTSYEPVGYIDVLDRSGLMVRGSGEVAVRLGMTTNADLATQIENQEKLELWIDLPIDSSERSAQLQVSFRRTHRRQPGPGSQPGSVRLVAAFAAAPGTS